MRMTFMVESDLHGQGRPRSRFVNGHVMVYESKADRDYKRQVAEAFEERAGEDASWYFPYKGPVGIEITCFAPLPKSTPKRVTSEPNTVKPDVDNIAKAVLDALNGLAYTDDSHVVSLSVVKMPRTRTDCPSQLVTIKTEGDLEYV